MPERPPRPSAAPSTRRRNTSACAAGQALWQPAFLGGRATTVNRRRALSRDQPATFPPCQTLILIRLRGLHIRLGVTRHQVGCSRLIGGKPPSALVTASSVVVVEPGLRGRWCAVLVVKACRWARSVVRVRLRRSTLPFCHGQCGLTQRSGLGHYGLTASKIRWANPSPPNAPPIGQRRGTNRPRRDRKSAGLPPQIKGDRIDGLAIGQALQRLQRDRRRHHIGQHAGPAPTGGEQIGEHLIREQLLTMRRQERKKHCPPSDDDPPPTPHPAAPADTPSDPAHQNHRGRSRPTADRLAALFRRPLGELDAVLGTTIHRQPTRLARQGSPLLRAFLRDACHSIDPGARSV